ncbi:MAG: substrate-binding domain-containing protein [Lentisphaeria bacterium]|nr:substrate-binding domain-containing protein [Lentisphaeria bacterium]
MKRNYFSWLLGIVAVAAVLLLNNCGKQSESGKQVIGVSIPSADHGWTGGVVWWAEKAKAEMEAANPHLKIILSTARDAAEQVDKVENLLVQGIQALVILPHEPGPLTGICEKVARQGVYLVVVDRGLDKAVQHVTVAGDNPGFGRACAKALAENLQGRGKIVLMEGIPCTVNSDRVNAFREIIKHYPEISILDSQPAYWDTEKGLKLMENYLQKYQQIDAVWTGDDDVLLGALKAYQESGRKEIRFFVGGAGNKVVNKMVLDRNPLVPFNVTYPPRMIVTGLEEAQKGLKLQKDDWQTALTVIVPTDIITPDNAAQFYFPDSNY